MVMCIDVTINIKIKEKERKIIMENIIERISELYEIEVYKGNRNSDYVEVSIGDSLSVFLPANCALPSVLCAAREFGFTGKIEVIYRYDCRDNKEYNYFFFEEGRPTYKEPHCCYTIYGEEHWKNGN